MTPVALSQGSELRSRARALLFPVASALGLAACGGGSGPGPGTLASTPTQVTPPPAPPPVAATNYDTAEYRRSSAAVQSGAIAAWRAGHSGSGVSIGFIDSGIDASSPEFAGRISSASRDVSGQNRGIQDVSGHGTAVAGVAASARNGSGPLGIAWNATIVAMRADNGQCTDGCNYADSAIAAGIDAAVAAGARVVNVSLGGSSASGPLRNAFARAAAAGTVIVLSAGNDGAAQVDPLPAGALASGGAGNVIIAGSADAQGAISTFSNRAGSARNNYILALGEDVRSFDHTGQAFLYSGTSFSAPAVSAAAALLAQAFPNLTGSGIVEILLSTADDVGAPGTDSITGRGTLNVARAIAPIGQTSLAGTGIAVAAMPNGNLGSAMGNGLSGAAGFAAVPVTDRYDRAYTVSLGPTLRSSSAGRLAGRLEGASLISAGTEDVSGPFTLGLQLRATSVQDRTAADAFRDEDRQQAHLGFAQRGVDSRAATRNPLRETRLSIRAGGAGLTMASGRLAREVLPGAAAAGFVADDGLSPDEGTGTSGRQLVMADTSRGPLTLALAAETRRIPLPGSFGLSQSARQDRLTLAASYTAGPLLLAAHATDTQDSGALLGTRFSPGFGLQGGHTRALGFAAAWAREGYGLRLSGTRGWITPDFASGGLLMADGQLSTRSWSATATAPAAQGLFTLRIAQPLALAAGRFRLANGTPLDAAVTARETIYELGFDRGPLGLAAFHRADAGNILGVSDTGAAATLRTAF